MGFILPLCDELKLKTRFIVNYSCSRNSRFELRKSGNELGFTKFKGK